MVGNHQRNDNSVNVSGGEFGSWSQVGIALETETTLTDQPRCPQLEYRIIAVNKAGEGEPSNTEMVVL